MENSTNAVKGEGFSKRLFNSPFLQALSCLTIFIGLSSTLVFLQYIEIQNIADQSRSQVRSIKDEYDRFSNGRDSYLVLAEDISTIIENKKPVINNFEQLYIGLIIDDLDNFSNSDIYQGKMLGDISLAVSISSKRLNELITFYNRIEKNDYDNKMKSSIIHVALKLAAQENVTYKMANEITEEMADGRQLVILSPAEKVSLLKVDLMYNALKFGGFQSSINEEYLHNTCLILMSNFNAMAEVEGKYPYKELLQKSFEYFLIKGNIHSFKGSTDWFDHNTLKNVFGVGINSTKYSNLMNLIKDIHACDTIKSRIDRYNEWIARSWYLMIDNPAISITPIDINKIHPVSESETETITNNKRN